MVEAKLEKTIFHIGAIFKAEETIKEEVIFKAEETIKAKGIFKEEEIVKAKAIFKATVKEEDKLQIEVKTETGDRI
jgi:hypothetical protein